MTDSIAAPTDGLTVEPAQPQTLDYNRGARDALNEVETGLRAHGNVDPEDLYQIRVRYGIVSKPTPRDFLDLVDMVCRDDTADYYGEIRTRLHAAVRARFIDGGIADAEAGR